MMTIKLIRKKTVELTVPFKNIKYLGAFEYSNQVYLKIDETLASKITTAGPLPPTRWQPNSLCRPLCSRLVV